MRVLVQRVGRASVEIDGEIAGIIEPTAPGRLAGLLLLVGIGREDNETVLEPMARKIVNLRIFPDAENKMNRSIMEEEGSILAVIFVLISGIPIGFILRRLRWLFVFMIPFLVLLPLNISTDGGLNIHWSRQSAAFAVVVIVRALSVALIAFPMWGTAPFHQSLKSLQNLGAPPNLVQMILFSYRYLFVYLDQLRKLKIAMIARGMRSGLSLRSARAYAHLVGMLLVSSYEQTERLVAAMKSRGFQGEIRTLSQPRRRRADWFKLAAVSALAAILVLGDRLWR